MTPAELNALAQTIVPEARPGLALIGVERFHVVLALHEHAAMMWLAINYRLRIERVQASPELWSVKVSNGLNILRQYSNTHLYAALIAAVRELGGGA